MSHKNVELVRRGYEQGDGQRAVDFFRSRVADDFRFHPRPGFPGGKLSYELDDMPQLRAGP
jgi:hypothetical protein